VRQRQSPTLTKKQTQSGGGAMGMSECFSQCQ
jgi:hypothetical protein